MLGHAPPFLCTILQDIAHRNAGNAISLMIKMNSNFRLVVDHSMDAPQSLDQARAAFFPGVNHPCVPSMLGRGVGGGYAASGQHAQRFDPDDQEKSHQYLVDMRRFCALRAPIFITSFDY